MKQVAASHSQRVYLAERGTLPRNKPKRLHRIQVERLRRERVAAGVVASSRGKRPARKPKAKK